MTLPTINVAMVKVPVVTAIVLEPVNFSTDAVQTTVQTLYIPFTPVAIVSQAPFQPGEAPVRTVQLADFPCRQRTLPDSSVDSVLLPVHPALDTVVVTVMSVIIPCTDITSLVRMGMGHEQQSHEDDNNLF